MRNRLALLCILSVANAVPAQVPAQSPDILVQVRTLTIISKDLPQDERAEIVRAFQGKAYPPEELAERVRQKLRDFGYAQAIVNPPQLSAFQLVSTQRTADVNILVVLGARYRLDKIRVEGNAVMPSDLILEQFPIDVGDLFNATAIGKGLDNLRNLYVSQGYINVGIIPKPQMDEARHTLGLTLDIDEGARYYFGRLFLSGAEPHAGAGNELLAAWDSVEDKAYDPKLLTNWLAANATFLPGVTAAPDKAQEKYVTAHQDAEKHRVDIELHFP